MQKQFTVVYVDAGASKEILTEEQAALNSVGGCIRGVDCNSADEIIRAARDADMLTTNLLPIPAHVIDALSCKAILRRGVGYDGVDVARATARGIMVINIPDFCEEELANHAIAMLLCAAKKIPLLDRLMRSGSWERAKERQAPMPAIHGETLGIIGCGRSGRNVAKKAAAFGLRVCGYDKYASPESLCQDGILPVSLSELLKSSDYISLHIGLNSETFHLIGEEELSLMKHNAILINTSRGANIDESALISALKNGKIAGACLDVFEQEPLAQNSPLLQMEQVILTPHSASYSDAAFRLLREKAGAEEVRVARGERPLHLVNPLALAKSKELCAEVFS